jgi:hypothetical protein
MQKSPKIELFNAVVGCASKEKAFSFVFVFGFLSKNWTRISLLQS